MNRLVATPVKAWERLAKPASAAGSPVFAVLRRGRRRQLWFIFPMRARRAWRLPLNPPLHLSQPANFTNYLGSARANVIRFRMRTQNTAFLVLR